MALILALIFLVGGTALLLWGADWFVDGVRDLALKLGVSIFLLSIVLAGLEPEEMMTAAVASAQGAGGLALGDVIGTNITMMTLALGLAALFAPVVIPSTFRQQALLALLFVMPPLLLLSFIPIGRIVGILLLLLYVCYLFLLWRRDHHIFEEQMLDLDDDDDDDDEKKTPVLPESRRSSLRLWLMTIGGLIAMAAGGPLIVSGALQLTATIGLGNETIGGTIVALGTGSELIALGWSAGRKGQPTVLLGGILGSFVYNLLVTLGLAAVINPLPRLSPSWIGLGWVMLLGYLVFLALLWRGKFGRKTGIVLLCCYVLYLIVAIIGGIITV